MKDQEFIQIPKEFLDKLYYENLEVLKPEWDKMPIDNPKGIKDMESIED